MPGGSPSALADGEGLVILDIDSDQPLERITAGGSITLENLPRGRSFRVVRTRRGAYRWRTLRLAENAGVRRLGRVDREMDEFNFEVVAGKLNYPGQVVIRSSRYGRSAGLGFKVRHRNHAAMALRKLKADDPDLLEAFPLHHAGGSGDGFLEHYASTASGLAASAEPMASRSPRPNEKDRFVLPPAPRDGLAAAELWSFDGVREVKVSPGGDYAIAQVRDGLRWGVLVQALGSRQIVPAMATKSQVYSAEWIGPDRFLVTLDSMAGRLEIVYQVLKGRKGLFVSKKRVDAPGYFVAPLPEDGEHVIWSFSARGKTSVNRVAISDLVTYRDQFGGSHSAIDTGERRGVIEGFAWSWVIDADGQPRAALRRDEDGVSLMTRLPRSRRFRKAHFVPDGETASGISPVAMAEGGKDLLVLAYGGKDTLGVHRFDIQKGQLGEEVFRKPDVDIVDAQVEPFGGSVVAYSYRDAGTIRYEYTGAFSEIDLGDWDEMGGTGSSESLEVVSVSADRSVVVLRRFSATNPGTFYLYEIGASKPFRIGQAMTDVQRDRLVDPRTLSIPSAEAGAPIEAYLTLPPAGATSGAPAPLIVHPHGGPVGVQDARSFNPLVQYLASWGFAVLQVNYRGSAGFGLAFQEAGHKEWGRGIEDDIDAAVAVAAALPEVDGSRLCSLGGSYGGFSAVALLIRHPDRYRCGVTFNGVADIPLMFETSDFADSDQGLAKFSELAGDLSTEREDLVARSPAYAVEKIRAPVFVAYGTDDQRVDPEHAHRLILMLETHGLDHESLELTGAEHSPSEREWVLVARPIRSFLTRSLFDASPGAGGVPKDPVVDSAANAAVLGVEF